MEFRKASLSDLKAVTAIFQAAVHHMDEQGIPQWDELYPAEEDLKGDITRSEMTLGLENGTPVCNIHAQPRLRPGVCNRHMAVLRPQLPSAAPPLRGAFMPAPGHCRAGNGLF